MLFSIDIENVVDFINGWNKDNDKGLIFHGLRGRYVAWNRDNEVILVTKVAPTVTRIEADLVNKTPMKKSSALWDNELCRMLQRYFGEIPDGNEYGRIAKRNMSYVKTYNGPPEYEERTLNEFLEDFYGEPPTQAGESGDEDEILMERLRQTFPKPGTQEKTRVRYLEIIKLLKASPHLTQEQLAEQLGVSVEMIKKNLSPLRKHNFI